MRTTGKQCGLAATGVYQPSLRSLWLAADTVRQEKLYKKDSGAISVRRVEIAQATLKQAEAKVAGARADLQKAIDREKGAHERLMGAQSAVDKAVSAPESTPFFRTPSATDFLLSHHNAGECHGPDRQY